MSRLHAYSVCTLLVAYTTAHASKPSNVVRIGGEATTPRTVLALDEASETADEEHEPNARDPWKSLACTQACEAGGEAMENFCRALPNRTSKQKAIREACWASSRASKSLCVVFCNAYFGPPAKPRQ